jgi:hypothetical protein
LGVKTLGGAVVADLGRDRADVVERLDVPGGEVRPALALEELRERQTGAGTAQA